MKLLLATTNRHKLEEIKAVLNVPDIELFSLSDIRSAPEVVEDGVTFESNAEKKARELAAYSGMWALADDSGLEVDALGGAPGVFSARYAGEPPDYDANNRKLLAELGNSANRSARFVCAIALCDPDGFCRSVRGVVEGVIAHEARGGNGFGYDPLFVPCGNTKTFAELSSAEKNAISHRAAALSLAVSQWRSLLV